MKLTNVDAHRIKKDFPLLAKNMVYVDNAATTQKPQAVIDALQHFYTESNANIHRGVYALSEKATQAYENARLRVTQFLDAREHEVVFTSGTTESMNLIAHCLPHLFNERKEVVLSVMEHHANIVPWQQAAKHYGLTLKYIRIKDDLTLDYDHARELITEQTAVVSIMHVSNALGTCNDVSQIIRRAQEKGAYTVIDAAQSVPHMNLSMQELNCDFLAFSGHKMCGPTGIGVLCGRKAYLAQMPPFHTGGDMIRRVTFHEAEWNDVPMKFEAGTPHIAGAVGLARAIDYLDTIGFERIHIWNKELAEHAVKHLQEIPQVKLLRPPQDQATGIVSFIITGVHPHDVSSLLDDYGICVRGGHHCAMPLMDTLGVTGTSRMSFYLYNTREDVDAVIDAIKKAIEVLT